MIHTTESAAAPPATAPIEAVRRLKNLLFVLGYNKIYVIKYHLDVLCLQMIVEKQWF